MNNDRKETERRELRRNQIVGILGGVIGGVMVAFSWPGVEEAIGLTGAMMWGAAIGGVLGSLQQFGQLGKRITHSDNGALNILVGVSIPLLIVAVLALIFRLAGYG